MSVASSYAVTVQPAPSRSLAAVHTRLPLTSVSTTFRRYLDQVYAAARAGAVHLDGQNVFIYRPVADALGEVDVAFGVGVTAPFAATGNVQPTALPSGTVATTTHWGNYAGLGAAHNAIIEWCGRHGHALTGTRWEIYGHWTDDESALRTDVFYLIEAS
jgi:effector-binding domain-containing protein